MTRYDETREMFGASAPEEKLSVLRMEVKRILEIIGGYGTLLESINPDIGLPDEYLIWCNNITQGVRDIHDIIDGLTDTPDWNRETRKRNQEENDRNNAAWSWATDQAHMAELRNYSSFSEAVIKTIEKFGMSLPENILQSLNVYGGILTFHTPNRLFRFGVQMGNVGVDRKYQALGYYCTLGQETDRRNFTWESFEGLTKSLDDVCTAFYRWLVEGWSLDVLRKEYPWIVEPTEYSKMVSRLTSNAESNLL